MGNGKVVRESKERKGVMKKLVKQRNEFARSHFNYLLSLSSLSSALSLFISLHHNNNSNDDRRDFLEALSHVNHLFLNPFLSSPSPSLSLSLSAMFELPPFLSSDSGKSLFSACSTSTCSTSTESGDDRNSLLSSSTDLSLIWMENKRGLAVNANWGMVSGCHSFTLGRLCAWEKKLYVEVKAEDQTLKMYKRKFLQLKQKDMEAEAFCPSKATAEVISLYHLLSVSKQRVDSIFSQIEKLRDEELLPQLLELLHGLMIAWKSMFETHEVQKKIMQEIKSFSCSNLVNFPSNTHQQATLELEAGIRKWQSRFLEYVSAQKLYVKYLEEWLSDFVKAYVHGVQFKEPTLLIICHKWLTCLERLPDKAVKYAMKSLAEDIKALRGQQGIHRKHMRRLLRKIHVFDKKAGNKALLMSHIAHNNLEDEGDSFKGKQHMDTCKRKLDMEQQRNMRLTINRLQMGFFTVFESLADFSSASVKIYADLITFSQVVKV